MLLQEAIAKLIAETPEAKPGTQAAIIMETVKRHLDHNLAEHDFMQSTRLKVLDILTEQHAP